MKTLFLFVRYGEALNKLQEKTVRKGCKIKARFLNGVFTGGYALCF